MKDIPDVEYDSYTATMEELREKKYKQRVNSENRNKDYSKFAINKEECDKVIQQNINKASRLAGEPLAHNDVTLKSPNLKTILEIQLQMKRDKALIAVLCTCIFYIFDYNPKFIL